MTAPRWLVSLVGDPDARMILVLTPAVAFVDFLAWMGWLP